MNKTQLEPDTYYICDPCLVLSKIDYSRMITNNCDTEFIYNYFMAVQKVGGGIYTDIHDKEYSVDSGLFGIFSINLLDVNKSVDYLTKVTFTNKIEVCSDENEFIITDFATGKVLFKINFNIPDDEDDDDFYEEDSDSPYDFDENDFESQQDCCDDCPSWYPH